MGTTNLFVELVVIGAGVVIWLALLVVALLGIPESDFGEAILFASAIPLLATTYVAGIVWDRIADALFEKLWVDRWRPEFFPDKANYYDARRTILTQSERLSELLEYGRSRMRICRAWVLNAFLIGLALNLVILTTDTKTYSAATLVLTVTVISLAFSLGTWFAWASLVKTEYRKIREQAEYLRAAHHASTPTPP